MTAGVVSVSILAAAMAVIGVCSIVPQLEENASLEHELAVLKTEHERIESQIKTNDAFVLKLDRESGVAGIGGGAAAGSGSGGGVGAGVDPTLLARLAQRQLRVSPQGTATLEFKGKPVTALEGRSPFQIVSVPRAEVSTSEVVAAPGLLSRYAGLLGDARTRLYLLAGAFFAVAATLILDSGPGGEREQEESSEAAEGAAEGEVGGVPTTEERPAGLVGAEVEGAGAVESDRAIAA